MIINKKEANLLWQEVVSVAGNNIIQFLRGAQSVLNSSDVVPNAGQPVFATDTGRLYIGDGATQLKNLTHIGKTNVYQTSTDLTTTSIGDNIEISGWYDTSATPPKLGDIVLDRFGTVAVAVEDYQMDFAFVTVRVVARYANHIFYYNGSVTVNNSGGITIDKNDLDRNVQPDYTLIDVNDILITDGSILKCTEKYEEQIGFASFMTIGVSKIIFAGKALSVGTDGTTASISQSDARSALGLGSAAYQQSSSFATPSGTYANMTVGKANALTSTLSISGGGTGGTTATQAMQNLTDPLGTVTQLNNSNSFLVRSGANNEVQKCTGATFANWIRSDVANVRNNVVNEWSAEQHFNQGFSALNNNFRFSDTTNIGMELGRQDGTPGTPYIDFHTDGESSTDYNSRILATGNTLQITASGGMSLNNNQILTTKVEEIPFSINTDYFEQTYDAGNWPRTRMYKFFGSDLVMLTLELTTLQQLSNTSVYLVNQFPQERAGYTTQFGLVARGATQVVGRCRINRGGTAIWLDTFSGVTIAQGTTIQTMLIYRCALV